MSRLYVATTHGMLVSLHNFSPKKILDSHQLGHSYYPLSANIDEHAPNNRRNRQK